MVALKLTDEKLDWPMERISKSQPSLFGDGFTDEGKLLLFASALLDPLAATPDELCTADTKNDAHADGLDIESFIALILS